MFRLALITASLLLLAKARPQDSTAETVKSQNKSYEVEGDTGSYEFGFKTSNGIERQESAQIDNVNSDNPSMVVRGEYSYTGPDGKLYRVTYVADDKGYHPTLYFSEESDKNVEEGESGPSRPTRPRIGPVLSPIPSAALASLAG